MVDGIGGINGTSGLDAAQLKALIKEAVAEELEEQKKSSGTTQTESDEEAVVEIDQDTSQENDVSTGILDKFTALFEKVFDVILAVIGTKDTGKVENTDGTTDGNTNVENAENPDNSKYQMTASEKAYLTMNPDFVRNLIAEEKFEEQYGNKSGFWRAISKKRIIEKELKPSITDAEIQAYLQLHPNVIKEAMYKDGINIDDTTINEPKTLSEDEKAYLTMNPDFVRDLIAEERFEEQYGNKSGFWRAISKKGIIEKELKPSITDAEIQAYLQLHPNVIKEAIAKG